MIILDEKSEIQYGLCESSDSIEMAELLAYNFAHHDPPAKALGITPEEFATFVQLFCRDAAQNELTVIARDKSDGKLVGTMLAQDAASEVPPGLDQVSEKFMPIFALLEELEEEYWQGSLPNPGEAIHLFLLGVDAESSRTGIGQTLVKLTTQNALRKGYQLAVTEATNNASQHIFRKLGFNDCAKRLYESYTHQGQTVFADIEEHSGPVLMEKKLI